MADEDYTKNLEEVIKQMLKPLKNVPFNLIIEELSGKRVVMFDFKDKEHKSVLELLKKVAVEAGREVNKTGILRPRPNEVGNDIERYVKTALNNNKLNAETPRGPEGGKKAVGYPDIIFWYSKEPFYIECKTYNAENIATTQRSFYFSPSDEFKVVHDALHFLLSYEIYVDGEKGDNHIYKCRHYKILSIEKLLTDVKHEFNSDNKRMYSGKDGTVMLAEGDI